MVLCFSYYYCHSSYITLDYKCIIIIITITVIIVMMIVLVYFLKKIYIYWLPSMRSRAYTTSYTKSFDWYAYSKLSSKSQEDHNQQDYSVHLLLLCPSCVLRKWTHDFGCVTKERALVQLQPALSGLCECVYT